MFDKNNSFSTIKDLISDFKQYLRLQKEYTQLEITEKLSILLSTLITIIVLIILSTVVLFYLTLSFAFLIAPYIGGMVSSFAIIAILYIILILITISCKKKLIINPMVRFLANLFITNDNNPQNDKSKEL